MDLAALKFIAIGLTVFGMLGAALGVASVFSSALNGITRNPESESKVKSYIYVGAGMVEFMGLLSFVLGIILILVA